MFSSSINQVLSYFEIVGILFLNMVVIDRGQEIADKKLL